jgi:hypothetical protein
MIVVGKLKVNVYYFCGYKVAGDIEGLETDIGNTAEQSRRRII